MKINLEIFGKPDASKVACPVWGWGRVVILCLHHTTRATKGWRASVATLKEASLEFQILYDTEDEDYNAFADAYFNNTPMALFVTDGNGTGLDADFSITGFSIEQPLEEALAVSVTAKPTASERAPQWTKGSGGGVGG